MGMFDGLYVARSLIEKAIEGTDINLELIQTKEQYLDFQTKDLDNTLTSFYIEEDGTFCYEHQEYEWIKPDSKESKSWIDGLPYQNPIGDPTKIPDKRTTYINFYDFYYTNEERVWVDFTAHIKNGMLVEPIKIKKVEKTNLEEEAIAAKKSRLEWDKIQSTWQWQVAGFIFNIKCAVNRWIYPFKKLIDNVEFNLRKQAKKGTSLDENICN